jgi:hypothetical protein
MYCEAKGIELYFNQRPSVFKFRIKEEKYIRKRWIKNKFIVIESRFIIYF